MKRYTISLVVGALFTALLARPASAEIPTAAMEAVLTAAALGQSGTNNVDRKRESDDLVKRARAAMKAGNLDDADRLILQAEKLNVAPNNFDPFAKLADSPAKARKDLMALKARAAASRTPSDKFAPPPLMTDTADRPKPWEKNLGKVTDTKPANTTTDQAEMLIKSTTGQPAFNNTSVTNPDAVATPNTELSQSQADRVPGFGGGVPPLANQNGRPTGDTSGYQPPPDDPNSYLPKRAADKPSAFGNTAFDTKTNELSITAPSSDAPPNRTPSNNLLADAPKNDDADSNSFKLNRLTPAGDAPKNRPPMDNALAAKKQQSQRFVALAQAAMDRGDLTTAKTMLDEANRLQVPENAYASDETRPWQLSLELDRRLNRGMSQDTPRQKNPRDGVVQAGNSDEPTNGQEGDNKYPVAKGYYDPKNDRSRNVPAANATVAEPEPIGKGLPPSALGGSGAQKGRQLYEQGMTQLQKQDRTNAIKSFKEAWKYQAELDEMTRYQLKEKLSLLQDNGPAPLPAGRDASPLEVVDAKQKLLFDRMSREIFSEQEASEKMARNDAPGALQRLQKLRERIAQSELDPAARKQLQTMVDRNIARLEKYIDENRSEIENTKRNARIIGEMEQRRTRKEEIQNKLAELVEQFNQLVDEKRYQEAEVVARQAMEIDPENPVVEVLKWKSKFVRRLAQQNSIDSRKEDGFVHAMFAVDAASIPFDDNSDPLVFGDSKKWREMTRSRRAIFNQQRKRYSPAEMEIERSLSTKVEVRYNNRPLKEVIETLAAQANINFYLDPHGLSVEGVSSETPVSLNLNQPISLKSALQLILEPLHLNFVIQSEVLKITTQQSRESNIYPQVYDVADLVIPIPNFVPGYNTGLPSAIMEAHRAMGHGTSLPGSGSVPITLAANQTHAPTASVLAQMGASGVGGPGGTRGMQQMGAGPGGLGGGAQADFDTLISLLTSSVSPKTWSEVGGSGTIEPMPSNLSVVVSQTQEVHEQIADLLEQLRRLQDLQVTIEVRFITLIDNFFERIGVDFNFNIDSQSGLGSFNGTPALFPTGGPTKVIGLTNQNGTGVPTTDLSIPFSQNSFASAVPQFGGFDPNTAANFGFAILSDIEVFFLIQASQGDQRSNILQAPKVTLFNGQQAAVFDTAQVPFVIGVIPVVGDFAAAHMPVVVVLNEGTSMSVQAVVSSDRRFVRLTLVPFFSSIGNVSTFTFSGTTTTNSGTTTVDPTNSTQNVTNGATTTTTGTTVQLPTFQFTTVTTTVSVPDGGTVLLGGIKRLREGRTERGVPILSKIPYISRLFKNVGIGREAQSLMLMVTPRIIIQEEEENKLGLSTTPSP